MDPTLLGALIGGGAAVVGGGVTGLIPYWVGRKEWVRDRAAHHMEQFFVVASRYVDSQHPKSSTYGSIDIDAVADRLRIMEVYAPSDIYSQALSLEILMVNISRRRERLTDVERYRDQSRLEAHLAVFQVRMMKSLGVSRGPIRLSTRLRYGYRKLKRLASKDSKRRPKEPSSKSAPNEGSESN